MNIQVALLAEALEKADHWYQLDANPAEVVVPNVTLEEMTEIMGAARWALRKWYWFSE